MNQAEASLERAMLLLQQGRTIDAVQQLKNVLQQDPNNADALALMARCQFAQKNFDAGIVTMQSVLALEPTSYHFYLLGFGYYSAGKNNLAMEAFQQSQSLDPWFPENYGLMSHVLLEQKRFTEGLDMANEGLAIEPENITCLNARSIALNKMRKTADAIDTMQNALAQDPDNEYTHCTVGWNYLEKGEHKTATRHFKEALRINPQMHNAQEGLKEALKSKIAPYRWLLLYSFWLNNQGKKMRWIIPVGLYLGVRVTTSLLRMKEGTENIVTILVAAYLLFILTSWLITPLANFFLLFHRDGKYALTLTEKNTAMSVVASLTTGVLFFIAALLVPEEYKSLASACYIAMVSFLAMSVPLGNLEYPLSFKNHGTQNKVAMVLVALGLCTAVLSFVYIPAALVTGGLFLLLFVLNNWAGVFRR